MRVATGLAHSTIPCRVGLGLCCTAVVAVCAPLYAATQTSIVRDAVGGASSLERQHPGTGAAAGSVHIGWLTGLASIDPVASLFRHPERERAASWLTLWHGRYGPERWLLAPALAWSADSCESTNDDSWFSDDRMMLAQLGVGERYSFIPLSALSPLSAPITAEDSGSFASILSFGAESLAPFDSGDSFASFATACEPWHRPLAVTICRYGGEYERMNLLECDGSVSSDTLDRLSVLARPPLRERPELPLPLEPQGGEVDHEWLPQLKMVHPRLAWVLQRLASAFPKRMIYLVSGYRPEASPKSLHHQGRALDLFVQGIPNDAVFRFCRSLRNVGCGYYPNNSFVHIDVRRPTSPDAYWVDISGPSQPSEYVDSWPGVVDSGALKWAGAD